MTHMIVLDSAMQALLLGVTSTKVCLGTKEVGINLFPTSDDYSCHYVIPPFPNQ